MRNEAYDALTRYLTMAGQMDGSDEDRQRGARDRGEFGARYLYHDADGEYVQNELLVIRFLVEVCGIPFEESRNALIEDWRNTGVCMQGDPPPPEDMARQLLATLGNVFDAHEVARFRKDALARDDEQGSRYWQDVLTAVRTVCFVPEHTGSQNRS